jgi:hypothetical protein
MASLLLLFQVPTVPALLEHELVIVYEATKHRFQVTWLSETTVRLRVRRSAPPRSVGQGQR